ncbi:oligosaccharide biosynthesis protein Alg14 [Enterococcus faecium]|uniref:oligosaccharide biosynthesis protein Alg14 n=1 Tax=Enterococcus sp. E4-220 TaxID=3002970 RepID=UPI001A047E7D|nr:oligosaccharide biosynthesis protein Alg14 [Enterococcus sp. E4-220]EGP4838072.1 oligosaccharide biosynthesis protein Alg14 [Enterococcus faecium]EGP4839406.1 oligosaccharide biosynthesis protein Alg14 [Enterococcus faecium]MEB4774136.1 oligosaccharide biosynthesis protein Alg14 [Enterococcus sp. E4-220]
MNKKDVLLVAKNKSLYFLPSIRSLDVWSGKDLLQSEFIKSARQQLANYQLIVFLDYGFDMEMARRVRPFTNAKIVLFFWNHFKAEHEAMLKQAQDEPAIDEIYHFDFLEAKELGLKHNSSFYSKHMNLSSSEPKTDLFFGATNNGRKERAESYKQEFIKRDVTTNYFILPHRGNEQPGYLTYEEYLKKTGESRGILELLREGQQGVTLRTFESMYFQKKLVTDNQAIAHYHFYRPENIFLLRERDLDELPEFLHTPFKPILSELLEFYDAENWAKRFITNDSTIYEQYEYDLSSVENK